MVHDLRDGELRLLRWRRPLRSKDAARQCASPRSFCDSAPLRRTTSRLLRRRERQCVDRLGRSMTARSRVCLESPSRSAARALVYARGHCNGRRRYRHRHTRMIAASRASASVAAFPRLHPTPAGASGRRAGDAHAGSRLSPSAAPALR